MGQKGRHLGDVRGPVERLVGLRIVRFVAGLDCVGCEPV
jgi:hypothetical protein